MPSRQNKPIRRVPESALTPQQKLQLNDAAGKKGEDKIFPFEIDEQIFNRPLELAQAIGNGEENSDIRKKMANGIKIQIRSVKSLLELLQNKKHPMFNSKDGPNAKVDRRYIVIIEPDFEEFLKEMLFALENIANTLYRKHRSDDLVTEDILYLFSKEIKEEGLYDIFIKKNADKFIQGQPSAFLKKITKGSDVMFTAINEILDGNIGTNKVRVLTTILRNIDMKTEGFREFIRGFSAKLHSILQSNNDELIDDDIFSVYKSVDKRIALYNIYRKDIRKLRPSVRRVVAEKIDYQIKCLKRDYGSRGSDESEEGLFLFAKAFIERLNIIRNNLYDDNWDDSLITEDMRIFFGIGRHALPIYNIYDADINK